MKIHQICHEIKLIEKGITGTQKLKSQKVPPGRNKGNTNIWTETALETLNES